MSEASATSSRLVAMMHLTALPAWLALSRSARHEVVAQQVEPVLARHPRVAVRWIDVEAFTAGCSDVLLAETSELRQWNSLVEALRDTDLFARPLFRLEHIMVGIEDGFREYEQASTTGGAAHG